MDDKQLELIKSEQIIISQLRAEIDKHAQVISEVLINCDHLNPDNTSAVYVGFPGTYCKICGCNNEYGHLDEHLHKYHHWEIPKRDDYGMIK
jgi:hypothetical protein